jgi:hypothetical protein
LVEDQGALLAGVGREDDQGRSLGRSTNGLESVEYSFACVHGTIC